MAASCHEPAWIAFAEEHFGPARDRDLADDAGVLARALVDHERFAAVHGVAFVWSWLPKARAAFARELEQLEQHDVDDVSALALALRAGPAAEVLRAATELELRHVAALAPVEDAAIAELAAAVEAIAIAAPHAALRVELVRPLARRGRAFGETIYTGAPGVAGAEAEHLAWQLLHEAWVVDAHRALGSQAAFADVERQALGALRSRARAAGLAAAHGRWLATLDLSELGSIPDIEHGTE